MARFVIANRRTGLHAEAEKVRSRMSVAVALNDITTAHIVENNEPDDHTARRVVVVEADAGEVEAKLAALPADVIMEPEIIHMPTAVAPPDLCFSQPMQMMPAAAANLVAVTVLGSGAPLARANVALYTRHFGTSFKAEQVTNAAGQANFQVPPGHSTAAAVVVPEHGFWTMVARGAAVQSPIDCPRLPDGPVSWWHTILGAANPNDGAGVRVAVLDSGLGQNAALAHASPLGAFINGDIDLGAAATRGTDPHGTHVAGTIGARPVAGNGYPGIAPGCELMGARVFPPGGGASQADIANAIDAASREHDADLINMSLGASARSQVLHEAILDALERGTLCVAAAGNEAGAVNFPGALSEVVAVGALGLEGWGPPGSLSSTRLPTSTALFGRDNLYVSNFSCFGPEVDCAGPGVGIIATMPGASAGDEPYGGMDGTSMATPAVCGALAVLLSRDPGYLAMPRSTTRSTAARAILNAALRDVGVPATHQGRGMPQL